MVSKDFMFWSYYALQNLCLILRTTLTRKTALKSPVFFCRIFLSIVIRERLFDRQHAFLLLSNPVVIAWPSQAWMGKRPGTGCVSLASSTWVPRHQPPPPRAGGLLNFVSQRAGEKLPNAPGWLCFLYK